MRFAKKHISTSLILLLILKVAFLQQVKIGAVTSCQSNAVQNLLQSGTYAITNQRTSNSRVNTFQIVANYNIPPWGFNVAVSTARIDAYNQTAGTDYSIRAGRLNSTNIAIFTLLINADFSWSSIRASFLISSRSDFYLGGFFPDTQSLFYAQDSSFIAQHAIHNWNPTSSIPVSFIYLISGLKTSDNAYNVSLTQAGFNVQNGLISVRVNSNANPSLEYIYISYVVFFNSAPYVLSFYNPLLVNPQVTQNFEGVGTINGNSLVYEGYGINSTTIQTNTIPCLGSNCPTTCVTVARCTSGSGVVFLNQCFLCGFQEFYSNGRCIPRCTTNQTWSGTACQCKIGFTRINGVCRVLNCANNQIFNGVECICASGFQRVNGVCQQICPQSSLWNGVECICNQGFVRVDDRCAFICTPNGYLTETGACVCLTGFSRNNLNQCVSSGCGTNSVIDQASGRCICNPGSLFSRNQCLIKCPGDFTNAVIFQGTCVCIEGFEVVNGRCARQLTCTKANEILVNNQCVCQNGFQYNSVGLCIPNCLRNQFLVNQACQCLLGLTRNSQGLCVRVCLINEVLISISCQCVNGFARNASGSCVRTCSLNQALVNNVCECVSGFIRNTQGTCIRTCGLNEQVSNNQCTCIPGFIRNSSGSCVVQTPICGQNQTLTNNRCECKIGFLRVGTICVSQCRVNQIYDIAVESCVCRDGYGISPTLGLCDICQLNSVSTGLLSGCLCINGYKWDSVVQRCILIVCQANSSLSQNGTCVCNTGFYEDAGECKRIPTCPNRSTWDQTRLRCVCTVTNQNLINGTCQVCRANSAWNETNCVCRSGFFLIQSQCVTCSANSQYIRNNCVCNFGYFGNGISCSLCHSSCGTCSNSLSTGCLTCVNASFTLSNGVCTLNTCDIGFFRNFSAGRCDKCLDYCSTCSDSQTCDRCIEGFTVLRTNLGALSVVACVQICGDGKINYDECDDGNTINGDGCSSVCTVQSGWTCVGGSSTTRSQCSNIAPSASLILIGGHVALQREVLQGVSMTYLPPALTVNSCAQCGRLLNVSVTSSQIIPVVTVDYISPTQYKFVVHFNFSSLLGLFAFNFTVRINNSYSALFTAADMSQIKVVRIDTALLAQAQNLEQLSLNNLQTEKTTMSVQTGESFTIPGLPSKAIELLFPN